MGFCYNNYIHYTRAPFWGSLRALGTGVKGFATRFRLLGSPKDKSYPIRTTYSSSPPKSPGLQLTLYPNTKPYYPTAEGFNCNPGFGMEVLGFSCSRTTGDEGLGRFRVPYLVEGPNVTNVRDLLNKVSGIITARFAFLQRVSVLRTTRRNLGATLCKL